MQPFSLNYTGTEAIDIVKSYHPNNWQEVLETKKSALTRLSLNHNISIENAYRKYIIPVAGTEDCIVFFAALSELIKMNSLTSLEKSKQVIQLEQDRQNVANQIISLEKSKIISHEDQKTLRAYYTKLQQEHTSKINQLINAIEVIEPKFILFQKGLLDC
jgi:hypothetical protein